MDKQEVTKTRTIKEANVTGRLSWAYWGWLLFVALLIVSPCYRITEENRFEVSPYNRIEEVDFEEVQLAKPTFSWTDLFFLFVMVRLKVYSGQQLCTEEYNHT